MKFLLVYLNTAARNSFPIGITSMLTYLRSVGHECDVFDTTFYQQFSKQHRDTLLVKLGLHKKIANSVPIKLKTGSLMDDLVDKVGKFEPDIVGISLLSAHYRLAIRISSHLKRSFPETPIIFGGLHPTLLPEETISEESVDMICTGEGELTMAELLDNMASSKPITNVRNMWVKSNGRIFRNPMRELVDLNELPTLDWDFFDIQHIHSPLNGRMYRIGSVEFGRGCPFSCAYCSATALRRMTGHKEFLRRRDTDKIIADLKVLRDKYDVEMFYFLDESFLALSAKALKDFGDKYKREIGIPFYGMTHPVTVTEEKVRLLKEMGCYLMTIGIEEGNEEYRKNVLKRLGSNQDIIRAFELFHKYGINISAFAMIGLPYETREMIFETIELFRKCKPVTYSVGVFHPYVGSGLRDTCIKEGFFDPTDDNYDYPLGKSVLKMPQISAKEIMGLHRTFFLYTKIPKKYFPLVRLAEGDDEIAELQRELIVDSMSFLEKEDAR